MEKAFFSLDNFIATIREGSLARTNRFEVIITPPAALAKQNPQLVSLFAEQTSLPPINLNVRTHKVWGPSFHRPQSIEYGGEGITFVFHIDRDMNVKKFFDDWMHLIVNKNNFTVSYQNEYASTIDICQLNEQSEITYTAQLREAFPRSISLMELNNASQNQTHRLTVTFAYRYWYEMPDSRQTNPVPQSLLNPDVPRPVPTPAPTKQFNPNPYTDTGNLQENTQGSDLPIAP